MLLSSLGWGDAFADEPLANEALEETNFRISGFFTLAGGKVFSGSDYSSAGFVNCTSPCYVADWNNAGVYDKGFSLMPESRVGVQGTYTFNPDLSATVQVTSRAVDVDLNLEWGFLSYKFGNFDLHIGRKRIPLYFYSDFQDIGVAYPWVSPPADLYGWEASNYNGASLRYQSFPDGTGISGSVFFGSENIKEARYFKMTTDERVDVQWNNLAGADLEMNKDWWTVRFVYVQADLRDDYRESNEIHKEDMKAYGMAFNADFTDWFLLSEIGQNERHSADGSYPDRKILSAMAGIGYRYGKWTPMLTVSRYHEHDPSPGYVTSSWNTYAAGVRYDILPLHALKLQWNKTQDTEDQYTGNAAILRFSYDMQF